MMIGIGLRLSQIPGEIHNFRFESTSSPVLSRTRLSTRISCSRKKFTDADLASDFAAEVAKINTNSLQREEAMKKGREFLFAELCGFQGAESAEMTKKWKKMDEEEKLIMIKKFVSDWAFNFQPLSSRSVKEMVEEHVNGEIPPANSSGSSLIPGLKKLIGLSQSQ